MVQVSALIDPELLEIEADAIIRRREP
jgi:hypothetical protein